MFYLLLFYELFAVLFSTFLAWHFPVSSTISWILGILFLVAFNGLFVLMNLTHSSFFLAKETTVLCSFLLAAVSYLIVIFIINDFLLMIPQYGKAFFTHKPHFIYTLSILALFIGIHAVWNTQNIKIKHYHLSSDKNVSTRIAFLSDLHIAPHNMSVAKLREIFSKLKQLNPDYVILGGDIIEMQPDYFMERPIIELFEDFNTQNTVLAVIGNHEYYGGQVHDNVSAMQNAGVIVLKDEMRLIPDKNIAFIGRDDKTNPHRLPLNRLTKEIPQNMYQIVLDHNPASITDSIAENTDLQISGHTHNGQLFPFNFLVKYLYPNAYGHRKIKNTDTIVSSGIGTWGPLIRVGTQNEVVVIDINKP